MSVEFELVASPVTSICANCKPANLRVCGFCHLGMPDPHLRDVGPPPREDIPATRFRQFWLEATGRTWSNMVEPGKGNHGIMWNPGVQEVLLMLTINHPPPSPPSSNKVVRPKCRMERQRVLTVIHKVAQPRSRRSDLPTTRWGGAGGRSPYLRARILRVLVEHQVKGRSGSVELTWLE